MSTRPSFQIRLPAELTLQILDLLTAKQAQRMRHVSKSFRDLIDNQEKLKTLSRAISARAHQRL